MTPVYVLIQEYSDGDYSVHSVWKGSKSDLIEYWKKEHPNYQHIGFNSYDYFVMKSESLNRLTHYVYIIEATMLGVSA